MLVGSGYIGDISASVSQVNYYVTNYMHSDYRVWVHGGGPEVFP